jgi:hypothetical protein
MNTNTLAKLYDRLTPRERLPLIMAASARGDELEKDRLRRSAPQVGYRLPDYHGLSEGLLLGCLLHLLEVLDVAALYWRVSGLLAGWEALTDKDAAAEKLDGPLKMFAYAFTAKLDGWRRFCAELQVDPELLMAGLPGYDTVKRIEEEARAIAFTPEEATAYLQRKCDETAAAVQVEIEAVKVETEAAGLWAVANSRVELWGSADEATHSSRP